MSMYTHVHVYILLLINIYIYIIIFSRELCSVFLRVVFNPYVNDRILGYH